MEIIEVKDDSQINIVSLLAGKIWREHYIPILGKEQVEYMLVNVQSSSAISGQIREGTRYFLIKNEDENIGYLAVKPDTAKRELFLSKIYIEASMRGKGFGARAIEFVKGLAVEYQLGKVTLTVNRHNLGTIKVYQKMGFRSTGPLIQDIGQGFVMDDYRMELLLERPTV